MDTLIDSPTKVLTLTGLGAILVYSLLARFRRRASNEPPTVGYIIPWVGSALSMGKDPDGFLKANGERYGPVYKIMVMGQKMTVVISPSLISEVYRKPELYDFNVLRGEMTLALGMSRNVVDSPRIQEYMSTHHSLLLPQMVPSILENFTTQALNNIPLAFGATCASTTANLQDLIPVFYNTAARGLLGAAFPAEPTYATYLAFDAGIPLIFAEAPHFLCRKAMRAYHEYARVIGEYLSDSEKNPHEDASELVKWTWSFGHEAGWSTKEIALVLAVDIWASETNATWAVYWFLAFTLQNGWFARLQAEVDASRREWLASHPDANVNLISDPASTHEWLTAAHLPLFAAALKETLRLSTSVFSKRRVMQDTILGGSGGGGYLLREGESVILPTRLVHIDDEVHADAGVFDPTRYLDGVDEGKNKNKPMKDGKPVPNHSMPWGGGTSMCEGRHLAHGELKIFLALAMSTYNFEIVPGSTMPGFEHEWVGLGVLHARGDLRVSVYRRS